MLKVSMFGRSLATGLLLVGVAFATRHGAGTHSAETPKLRLVPGIGDEFLFDLEESPDGPRLVTNSSSRYTRSIAPRLWRPKGMRVLRVLAGHREPEAFAKFSWDGKWILTYS